MARVRAVPTEFATHAPKGGRERTTGISKGGK
jgi:hypothetical protein